MYSSTTVALEKFDNQHEFERMAADTLNALGYKDVVLMAPRGGSDGGRDIPFTTESGGKGLACVTLRKDIEEKFREDFSQRSVGEYEKYMLFCTAHLTAKQKLKFMTFCADTLEAEFVPQDIEALRSLLDSALKEIRKRYLNLDDNSSAKIRSHIIKLLKYPKAIAANAYSDHSGFVEFRYTEGMHRELFYFLSQYEDDEIKQMPVIGIFLTKYKEDYYQFKSTGDELGEVAMKVISDNVVVRFIQGWRIYFDYFLARLAGLSQDETVRKVNFNYEITPQEAERIYVLLQTHEQLLPLINNMAIHRNAMNEDISKLKELI
jgi:hypothetical protein